MEISNGIEIFGGSCAKESCEMYYDAVRTGVPERGAFVFYDCMCPGYDGAVNRGHCGLCLGDTWNVFKLDGSAGNLRFTNTIS